jgi:PTS system nitrogen regulatory IIA component
LPDGAGTRFTVEANMRLGIREVASQFGVTDKVVLRWVDEEGLPASKVDGQYRFSPAALFEWATARGMKVPPALFQEPQNGDREVLPNLVEALRAGGIVDRVPGQDKRSVLAAMIGHLKLPKWVDRAGLLQIIMAREKLGSTGIGEGIAIPHVRNPIVMRVPKPMLLLGLLEHPVEYGAVDHKPVHSVFLVITPTTRSHLHILSRLGYILQDESLRELLAAHAPAERILAAMEAAESRIPGGNTPRPAP